MTRLGGHGCKRSSASSPRSSDSLLYMLPTAIRLHVYSYLSEQDLSRLIRVNRQFHEDGVHILYGNTQFTFEVTYKMVKFYNANTTQDVQTSRQHRPFQTIKDLSAHFSWARHIRFVCYLDASIADEQQNLVTQAVTKLVAMNSSLEQLEISLLYMNPCTRPVIAVAAWKVLEPLRLLRNLGARVNMPDEVTHMTNDKCVKIRLHRNLLSRLN